MALSEAIGKARKRLGLAAACRVFSCYEAGREGFWLHRLLTQMGVVNLVVDSSSIEVNRRARRAKTDRLDARKLLSMLLRYWAGEKDLWSVVQVPTPEQEDGRHLQREIRTLKKEQTRLINRIKGLLASQGVAVRMGRRGLQESLDAIRIWDGSPLPLGPAAPSGNGDRSSRCRPSPAAGSGVRAGCSDPAGPGPCLGDCPASEDSARHRRGRRRDLCPGVLLERVQEPPTGRLPRGPDLDAIPERRFVRENAASAEPATATSAASPSTWPGSGCDHQPQSELTLWFNQRFARGGPRLRKIGIVALARKLVIALWRYADFGEIPKGALLKSQA